MSARVIIEGGLYPRAAGIWGQLVRGGLYPWAGSDRGNTVIVE